MISHNSFQNQQQVNLSVLPQDIQMIGLQQLQTHCNSVYFPNQPLFYKLERSFIREGGSKPLDFVHIYKNEGNPEQGIPRHWHYVGFGLSDIYSYGFLYFLDLMQRQRDPTYAEKPPLQQFYPLYNPSDPKSGFGIELTIRIKCNSDLDWNREPPKWPSLVMQALAKYVFKSKNVFSDGDHTAWNCSLDGEDGENESRIRHMLMTLDPQLNEVSTTHGRVKFIQLVGVCSEELQAAREWNVRGVLDIMKRREETGGDYLVTDMTRGQTIFELDPDNLCCVREGIAMGSDMVSISARHKYCSRVPSWFRETGDPELGQENDHANIDYMNLELAPDSSQSNQIPGVERGNFLTMARDNTNSSIPQNYRNAPSRAPSSASVASESELAIINAELVPTRYYDNLYLLLEFESAKLLPVVLNSRLAHRKHFSYKRLNGDLLTTLVPANCEIENIVSEERPFARRGAWLQIYVSERLREQMLETLSRDFSQDLESFETSEPIGLPKNYSWPDFKLNITVVNHIRENPEDE